MNRRAFLKSFGMAAAAVFALPLTDVANAVLGSASPESMEWHDLIVSTGVDITKNHDALRAALESSKFLLQRKLDQGWRQVGMTAQSFGYDKDNDQSWLRLSHQLVRA